MSGDPKELALLDLGGDELVDLGATQPGTTRLDVTDSVLALGRGNATRLGGVEGTERGPKPPGLGERGGVGNGTDGGGPLDFTMLDAESLCFRLEGFGSLVLDAEYTESLALDVSVSLPETLGARRRPFRCSSWEETSP